MLILRSGLVWFFFGIIKIHVFIHSHSPPFDDDNQVISFRHHQDMHDSHSPPLSSKFFFTSSKPAWFTFSPFLMMKIIIQGLIFLTSSKSSWFTQGRNFSEKKPGEFTPIPMSYAYLLPYMLDNAMGFIRLEKISQPPFPRGYNPNVTCAYMGELRGIP